MEWQHAGTNMHQCQKWSIIADGKHRPDYVGISWYDAPCMQHAGPTTSTRMHLSVENWGII